jgi:predicted RNA-binding Zn-ribbon protein involved in translation (DUF1610 family)
MLAGEALSRRNCRKKSRYKTENRARIVGMISAAKESATLYPYECPHCGQWHLTRQQRDRKPITGESSGIL